MEPKDLVLHNGELNAYMRFFNVNDDSDKWYQFLDSRKEMPEKVSNLDAY